MVPAVCSINLLTYMWCSDVFIKNAFLYDAIDIFCMFMMQLKIYNISVMYKCHIKP